MVAEAEAVLAGAREAPVVEPEPGEAPPAPVRPRFRDRIGKARSLLAGALGSVRSRTKIDDETWEELEEALIRADVGVTATTALLDQLRAQVKAENIQTPELLVDALEGQPQEAPVHRRPHAAHRARDAERLALRRASTAWARPPPSARSATSQVGEGRTVIMAAGDTFRAAAAEQLELWSKRVGATLVRGNEGGDPGAVVFDAVERAAARQTDLVLADTAGRLHTKVNLMEELKKVRRVADKPPGKVTEVLLVIDATTGQNGLVQAKQFTEAVEVTGVVLTKLDGTAKGGIVLAIQNDLGIPIKLVGLGETRRRPRPLRPRRVHRRPLRLRSG